jgi:hypothetical protein
MQSHVKLALQVCNYFCGYQNLVCVKRRVQDGKQRFKKYVKSNCSGSFVRSTYRCLREVV